MKKIINQETRDRLKKIAFKMEKVGLGDAKDVYKELLQKLISLRTNFLFDEEIFD